MTPALRTSILRVVASAFPSLVYGHAHTYKVTAVVGGKLDLSPPADAQHLPELAAVEQWGVGLVTPPIGSEVCVLFRDADPTRPIVVPFEPASSTKGVARLDDTVVVLLPPATFTGQVGGSPASGLITWSPPQTMGKISDASATVEVE